ncbi:hypothetical protein MMF93_17290 [Streptomyces tubbatahanensis]|uniref:Secreted protein n=1 Tax=Streptomyces tubbatahanensis TaxID=2923272 RepID=A0ABY3XUJ8_9ACTN|nr:hypothetical protein [Streptomyces tubbatahanensis]UNS98028.1 hypothetical protein MMF93_17290 [Streptomyces tubbatahanensis]
MVAAALTGIGTLVRWFVLKRLPARRTWRYLSAGDLSIVLDTAYIDTGRYQRPVAGLGQVRALSVIVPSLTHAYRDLDLEKVRLSAHLPGGEMEHDLLILGGPKNNEAARRILEAMAEALPFRLGGGAITWEGTTYTGDAADGEVTRDCGYIVRASNPLNSNKRVVLIGGWSTYGTVAAARWLAENGASRSLTADVAVLVEASVLRDGHVPTPRVVRQTSLSR